MPLRKDRDAGGDVLVLDAVDATREFGQTLLDRAAQLGVVFDLDRIVGGEFRQLIGSGQDVAGRGLVLGKELGRGCQEIGPRGAFRATDLEQQAGQLAFDLHGMHDEATGIAGLVDQEDGGDADSDQHQKSR